MKRVINILYLSFLLCSCSLFESKVPVRQVVNERKSADKNIQQLIIREKQSLKIALLQLEHGDQKVIKKGPILIEGSVLMYQFGSSSALYKKGDVRLLVEAHKLLNVIKRKKIPTIVLCQHELERKTLKGFLADLGLVSATMRFNIGKSLARYRGRVPLLIIGQNYDDLWPKPLAGKSSKQKIDWYPYWISLPNRGRGNLSAKQWSLLFAN